MVTRDATITMYAGIRTRSGITLRKADIIILENIKTTVVESPIPIPLTADVVTARVGHIPSIRIKVGFSFTIPLYKRSVHLFMLPPPIYRCSCADNTKLRSLRLLLRLR